MSRGKGYTLLLTPTEAVLSLYTAPPSKDRPRFGSRQGEIDFGKMQDLRRATLRMKLVRANPVPVVGGLDKLPSKSNYFIGNNPKKWHTSVANYAKVRYKDVYPGADPDSIILNFEGASQSLNHPIAQSRNQKGGHF